MSTERLIMWIQIYRVPSKSMVPVGRRLQDTAGHYVKLKNGLNSYSIFIHYHVWNFFIVHARCY